MIQPVGYLKLHRELYHKPIWKQSTPEQKVVLLTLLAMAWFNTNEWEWKGQKFKTEPGQFITSLDSIMIDCGKGISIQNVRSSLKRFEKLGFLTNESTKTGRLITIANWALYQPKEDNPTKQSTKTQQRGNKEVTPKEERKNDKNEYIVFFEECWKGYPSKKGKGQISDSKKKEVYKLGDEFKRCLDRYKKYVESEQWLKYQNGSTFFNSGYVDYLDSNYKQEPVKAEPQYNEEGILVYHV